MWHRARKDILSAFVFVSLACLILTGFYAAGNAPPTAGEAVGAVSIPHPMTRLSRASPFTHANESSIETRDALSQRRAALATVRPIAAHRFPVLGSPRFAAAKVPQLDSRQQEATSKKNLTTLATALQAYHHAHGHFPPATVLGPDRKIPHSWRVEVLPHLGHKRLYEQYRLTEPWDSPNNLKVLNQIPAVFHSPYDSEDSRNSGYFAFVGPGTVFEGTEGISIPQIIDGTNNTLLVAECCRNVPWTKPEDIRFDPAAPQPKFGGYIPGRMASVMVDGEYRLLTVVDEQSPDELAWLIIRDDRRPVAPGKVVGVN